MKHGYVIERTYKHISLYKVRIEAEIIANNEQFAKFAIVENRALAIWSSDPKEIGNYGYISNDHQITFYASGVAAKHICYQNLTEALVAAKQIHAEMLSRTKQRLDEIQKQYDELKHQVVDWDSFPKDTYVSPFSGKKV